MARQGIVKFDSSDGLSPTIVDKLNYNFKNLADGSHDNTVNINATQSIDLEQLRAAARDAMANYNTINDATQAALGYLLEIEADWEAINNYREEAGSTLIDIERDSALAKSYASEANAYARGTLLSLSDVERVIGTVNWITEHGQYVAAVETSPVDGRIYYTRSGSGTAGDPYIYNVVADMPMVYVLTEDVAIDQGKTYYTRSGSGTSEDPYVYTEVDEPDVADIATYYEHVYDSPASLGYYWLNIEESLQNYIASHLSQTDYGLDLMIDDSDFRIHIGTIDGTGDLGMYIIDDHGVIVGEFSSDGGVVVGKSHSYHTTISEDGIQLGYDDMTPYEIKVMNGAYNFDPAGVVMTDTLGIPSTSANYPYVVDLMVARDDQYITSVSYLGLSVHSGSQLYPQGEGGDDHHQGQVTIVTDDEYEEFPISDFAKLIRCANDSVALTLSNGQMVAQNLVYPYKYIVYCEYKGALKTYIESTSFGSYDGVNLDISYTVQNLLDDPAYNGTALTMKVGGRGTLPVFKYKTTPDPAALPAIPCFVVTQDAKVYMCYDNNGTPTMVAIQSSITGVKGNAESSYRTGDVNLTPANIGAQKKGELDGYYSSRQTSANVDFGDGKLRYFLATSSMTTGKPPVDSQIIHMDWDNTGNWAAQLAVDSAAGRLFTRGHNGGTWTSWKEFFPTSGGTLTGNLSITKSAPGFYLNNSAQDISTTLSALSESVIYFRDKNNRLGGTIWVAQQTSGRVDLNIRARRYNSSANRDNTLSLSVAADGTRSVSVSDAAIWRSALSVPAKSEAIKNITRSGTTFTATKADGTTFTFTQQDNNTVTKVKGDAESSYRSGNVNLTPANLNAVYGNGIKELRYASSSYMHVETSANGSYGISWWSSDERWKEDIEDSEVDALELVKDIKHRSFRMKTTGIEYDIGYVAQELEELDPQLVLIVPNNRTENDEAVFTGDYRYQVDERKLIPYLSRAIQQLSEKVEELEARIAELEGR